MSDLPAIGAIILAGGKSSRMGRDKAFIRLANGKMIIQSIIDAILPVTPHLQIIANSPAYHQFGFTVYEDLVKEKGPMGGLLTGLQRSEHEYNLVLGCDMPFITTELLQYLVARTSKKDLAVVASRGGRTEPLCGIYHKKCCALLTEMLGRDQLSLQQALQRLPATLLEISHEPFYSDSLLLNVNTPEELE